MDDGFGKRLAALLPAFAGPADSGPMQRLSSGPLLTNGAVSRFPLVSQCVGRLEKSIRIWPAGRGRRPGPPSSSVGVFDVSRIPITAIAAMPAATAPKIATGSQPDGPG